MSQPTSHPSGFRDDCARTTPDPAPARGDAWEPEGQAQGAEAESGEEAVSAVTIEVCRAVSDELSEALTRLVPQLSSSATVPSANELREIVTTESTFLLVARDGNRIVGTLTLATFRIPTGVRAWIEDVVVESQARGKGVGEALSREAIRIAGSRSARTVELTSRPSREAANRLYRRMGFEPRDTNVYRYTIGEAGHGLSKA